MIDIIISPYYVKKCERFALACAETNAARYRSRGQASIDKIVSDILVGKTGEVAVYLHKKSLGVKCSKPDFNIYHGRAKSYAADLQSEGKLLHIKTQSQRSAKLYGISFILQCKDGDKDKLFKHRTERDMAVLCVMKDDSTVTILTEVSINYLFDNNLIEEPKLKFFIGTKKAIYFESVKKALAADESLARKEAA